MGERETTPQELEAMREPVMRERRQRQEQEDYLARVRAKAEERAREILSAAYAERQKILAETHQQIETQARQAADAAAVLKEQARSALVEAEEERSKALALREEATQLREAMRQEGFQKGMEQAGTELKEFRADVARMLGGVLHGLEGQREAMCESWREALVEVTRVAVEAGTSWILQKEQQQILRTLVLDSLHLLEDRASVTIRVHPEDEEVVGDMFKTAREHVPELRQWIVEGDSGLEPGDVVAESVSGSVENLRACYREMVGNILEHLTLPQSEAEAQAEAQLTDTVARDQARLAEVVREAEPVPEAMPEEAELATPTAERVDETQGMEAVSSEGTALSEESVPDAGFEAVQNASMSSEEDASCIDKAVTAGEPEPTMPFDVKTEPQAMPLNAPQPDMSGELQTVDMLPPLDEDLFSKGADGNAVLPEEPNHPPATAASQTVPVDNPSRAELEDELFPLPEDESARENNLESFFSGGGFLPGSEHQG